MLRPSAARSSLVVLCTVLSFMAGAAAAADVPFALSVTVDGAFDGPEHVATADLDGDGDIDLLGGSSGSDEAVWWENNDGSGTSWVKHVLPGDGSEVITAVSVVGVVDIDLDGDLDVVAGVNGSASLLWWQNTSGDASTWAPYTVDTLGAVTK